jgi:hypothetical protein
MPVHLAATQTWPFQLLRLAFFALVSAALWHVAVGRPRRASSTESLRAAAARGLHRFTSSESGLGRHVHQGSAAIVSLSQNSM